MSARTRQKRIILYDPDLHSRKLLEELLAGIGYRVRTRQRIGKLPRSTEGRGSADLLVINLSLLGDSYQQVAGNLADLELATGAPPVVGITSLKLSPEARARLEQGKVRAVLSSRAPLMELIFTVNRLLFPKIRELRRYARVFGGFPVQFLHQERWQEGEVYNISREGAFIQTDNPPGESTHLQVRFLLPGQEVPFQAQAFVNWVNHAREDLDRLSPRGIGVSFMTLDPDAGTSLDRFLASRSNGEG